MNLPAASWRGTKTFVRIHPKGVTPECFYGGPVPVRLDSRYKPSGMTDLTGLRMAFTQYAVGN